MFASWWCFTCMIHSSKLISIARCMELYWWVSWFQIIISATQWFTSLNWQSFSGKVSPKYFVFFSKMNNVLLPFDWIYRMKCCKTCKRSSRICVSKCILQRINLRIMLIRILWKGMSLVIMGCQNGISAAAGIHFINWILREVSLFLGIYQTGKRWVHVNCWWNCFHFFSLMSNNSLLFLYRMPG